MLVCHMRQKASLSSCVAKFVVAEIVPAHKLAGSAFVLYPRYYKRSPPQSINLPCSDILCFNFHISYSPSFVYFIVLGKNRELNSIDAAIIRVVPRRAL